MLITLCIIFALAVAVMIFISQPPFGKTPSGESLPKVLKSPNFRDGKFQNIHHTPDLTEGVSYYAVLKEFIFKKSKRGKPGQRLPSKKTDLFSLDPNENVLVWFGHSSYFIQIDGKKMLVDPVFSGSASPIAFTTRSFDGSDIYSTDDIPSLDYLFISHDHWDHLDYQTITKLKPKVGQVICGLGVRDHLVRWGYDISKIHEKDWGEEIVLDPGFVVSTTSGRHFSGRGFGRNKSLWMSYVLQTPTMKIFIGGDSGYDTHFASIGSTFGPFDLVILECGQYDKSWKYIHMMPAEVVQAALDLKAKTLLPVHWGKFSLGNHDWDEPIIQVTAVAKKKNMAYISPLIGEKVNLKNMNGFSEWWNGIP